MKKTKLLTLLLTTVFLSSCANDAAKTDNKPIIEPDDTSYVENKKVDLRKPQFRSGDDEEEEEEETYEVNKVVINYYNEDGNCNKSGTQGRAFYVWVNGIDGQEYSDEYNNDPSRVTYSADGTLMTVTIDMVNDANFTPFKEAHATNIMYIIKYKRESASNLNWGGQSEDVELKFSEFNPDKDGLVTVWCTPAAGGGIAQFKTQEETQVEGIKLAKFTDWKNISCTLSSKATSVDWTLYAFDETYFKVKAKNRAAIKKNYVVMTGEKATASFPIKLKYNAHINAVYCIESKDINGVEGLLKTIYVSFEELYYTERFNQLFTYKGNDLGVTYSKEETTFKVWSPVAANVSLYLYNSDTSAAYDGSDKYKGWHMNYQPGGIWTLTVKGDLAHAEDGYKYFNYYVDTWATSGVAMDPYAHACGANGIRGLVYDPSETNPANWNSFSVPSISTPQELTIYEVHVQDFTGDESWISNKGIKNGTYNAFVESGTKYTANDVNGVSKTVSTGFDHLKDLGIGAVQLMPVFDSDNDEVKNFKYNWGYNPLNYNCVEGAYSSDPHDGLARIKEFKNMINELGKAGIRTIMDVVYNHVSSPTASCFNKLMPRYYFRYDENGELYDGSGCHNEFKSEAIMARKFIVESLCFWAKEYNIKGFRFDLMGLLDVETLRAAKKECFKIDPSIYLYGEGWDAAGFHGGWDYENNIQSIPATAKWDSNYVYSDLYKGTSDNECYLGGFNDKGRDVIRGGNDGGWGSVNHLPGWGFIQKGAADMADTSWKDGLEKTIMGRRADDQGANPCQTVNYVSCHDNWTLRDQLYYTLGNPAETTLDAKRPWGYDVIHAIEAAEALVFASNAPAFMLGGEEIARTKDVDFANEVDKEKVLPNTYEEMYGHKVSHNSYNSPIEVNSFKWGNKISVAFDVKGGKSDIVDMLGAKVQDHFKSMIKLHKDMPKYSYSVIQKMYDEHKTPSGKSYDNLSWYGAYTFDDHGAVAIQFDEFFIYVVSRNFGYFKDPNIKNWTQKLTAGNTVVYDDGEASKSLNLGTIGGRGFATAVYQRS